MNGLTNEWSRRALAHVRARLIRNVMPSERRIRVGIMMLGDKKGPQPMQSTDSWWKKIFGTTFMIAGIGLGAYILLLVTDVQSFWWPTRRATPRSSPT